MGFIPKLTLFGTNGTYLLSNNVKKNLVKYIYIRLFLNHKMRKLMLQTTQEVLSVN